MVGDGTFDDKFYPLSLLALNPQILHYKIVFLLKTHFPVTIDAHLILFLHNLGTGSSLSKTIFSAKINGGLG